MNTAAAPENAIAERRKWRFSAGLNVSHRIVCLKKRPGVTYKFLEKDAGDQSSTRREKMMRTGIERRLL
jgi:hypothetical protein